MFLRTEEQLLSFLWSLALDFKTAANIWDSSVKYLLDSGPPQVEQMSTKQQLIDLCSHVGQRNYAGSYSPWVIFEIAEIVSPAISINASEGEIVLYGPKLLL